MRNCKYCGRALEEDVVICPYCSRTQPGTQQSGADGGIAKPAARPRRPVEVEKRKKIILIALAVIIALSAFNIVIRLVIRAKRGGDVSDNAEQVSQVTEYASVTAGTTAAPETAVAPSASGPENTEASTGAPGTEAVDMSREELISLVSDAVSKTRDYTGDLTVKHSENFEFEIREITGGAPVKALANAFIKAVMSPSEDEIVFRGGKAEYEGETVPILLPDSGEFSLPAEGVDQIGAVKDGENTVVRLTLVAEHADAVTPPKYNAGAFGYVDLSHLDLPGVTPGTVDFSYGGTQIEYVIRPDGYVQKASYNAQLSIDGNGKLLVIPASLVSGGTMTEVWDLQWD